MDYPFAQGLAADALAHEAVFGARYPQLLLRNGNAMISFHDGEYRTSDTDTIAFLLGVVADEARANKGVWVKQVPTTTLEERVDSSGRPRKRTHGEDVTDALRRKRY